MPSIAHNPAARPPESKAAPPPPASENKAAPPSSWVRTRRIEGESAVDANETIGAAIRTQVSWLSLVQQQKIQKYGAEVAGSVDIDEVIVRLLDLSLEADGIEADFERLHLAEERRTLRKMAKTSKTKAPESKIAPSAFADPSSGMKPRERWFDYSVGSCTNSSLKKENPESVGEAMRRQVSAIAAAYRQLAQGAGYNSDIESGFARLMALSLEVEDLEAARESAKASTVVKGAASAATEPQRSLQVPPDSTLGDALRHVGRRLLTGEPLSSADLHFIGTTMCALAGVADEIDSQDKLDPEASTTRGGGNEEEEDAPHTTAETDSSDVSPEAVDRIAKRHAAERAKYGAARDDYNQISKAAERNSVNDAASVETLLLAAVGQYPGPMLPSLLDEMKTRAETLHHLLEMANGGPEGRDVEGMVECAEREMLTLSVRAGVACELVRRLGLENYL